MTGRARGSCQRRGLCLVHKASLGLLLVVAILSLVGCGSAKPAGKRVALYSDRGCWDDSVKAAERMFQWIGCDVTRVDAARINRKGLAGFDVLCVPGGNMYQYAQDISPQGKETIRGFVRGGGGYIGICAGAYFAAESVVWQGDRLPMGALGFFPGRAEGPISAIAPYPDYAMGKINIVHPDHPIVRDESASTWILYYWGPALLPSEGADVVILGSYDQGGQPAIATFDYGFGRVFLIGAHPEIEEDSDRDGVDFADEMDDRGSDWELMKKAVLWCLRNEG